MGHNNPAMSRAAALPFSAFGTRFKIEKARQRELLQIPALDEREAWPAPPSPLKPRCINRTGCSVHIGWVLNAVKRPSTFRS